MKEMIIFQDEEFICQSHPCSNYTLDFVAKNAVPKDSPYWIVPENYMQEIPQEEWTLPETEPDGFGMNLTQAEYEQLFGISAQQEQVDG